MLLLFDGDKRGTKEDFIKATGSENPIGHFIRSILGLERQAALAAFADFTTKGNLTADQQHFLDYIINYFVQRGVVQPRQLYDRPFTELHINGPDGVFSDDDCDNIISIIRKVNKQAEKSVG